MKLIAFGEMLWDIYSDKQSIGGAPLNFAAHFAKHGGEAWLVSAIGNDELGKEALEKIKSWNIETRYISILSNKETGKCLVKLNDDCIPTYTLLTNVAYDCIKTPILHDEYFDALYFGTLALRSEENLTQLKQLIDG